MFDKIQPLESRFRQLEIQMADPQACSDGQALRDIMKEYAQLSPLIEKYRACLSAAAQEKEAERILQNEQDPELREWAEKERRILDQTIARLTEEIRILLLPKDPDDDRNIMVEIRAGAGGEEAALFVSVLFRMYSMYAQAAGLTVSVLYRNETELGGYREISFLLEGEKAYALFKYESGVHRVQRIPVTESQGKIQTSTATVAVLPQAEEVDVQINPADVILESMKSSGAGGQHINKTESAVRLTHKPTGIVVECQEERSQYKNRDKAMKMLRTKLLDIKKQETHQAQADQRRIQIGTGDRSERIRTYNYPQHRVTDHRIGLTLYTLSKILDGDLAPLTEALSAADTAEKLKHQSEGVLF